MAARYDVALAKPKPIAWKLPEPACSDENVDDNRMQDQEHEEPTKFRTYSLWLPDEAAFRKRLKMASVYAWAAERTPRRRELFKNARVTIGKPEGTQLIPSLPSLIVLHGIEQTTWNKSIQALFSTQNCDVMFTLCSAIVYYQKALFTISNRPGVFEFEDKAISLTDSTARNYMFMASNVLAMKFYDDLHLSNNYISKVYRVPLKSLNKWEVKVLEILNYSLYIHQAERDQIKYDFVSRIEA